MNSPGRHHTRKAPPNERPMKDFLALLAMMALIVLVFAGIGYWFFLR